jgi:dTDP-glucose pyrophosphorylase
MKDIGNLIIQKSSSIIATMKQMDSVRHKSLLAFDDDKFYSIVTIGDLQRAIIANYDLNTSISEIINVKDKQYAYTSESIEEIKRRMLQIRCEYMPVLDKEGNLVDVYSWFDLFPTVSAEDNREPIDLPVVIMAGGLGTRLKPLTNVLPKPLIPIGDKTILEEILDQFEDIGCKNFYLSVNYKSDMIRYYLNHLEHKYSIEYFEETKPLGTIGSVSLLKGKISTPFFVSNCDIIIDQDYRDVYEYHINNKNELTIVTAMKSFEIPYGVIETGKDGLMTGLQEKPDVTYMINTGVYILNPECIDEIPDNSFFHITQLIERIKKRGGRIGCYPVSEYAWRDMGEWSEYLKETKVI